ncbi:MAG: cytidylyltransferase domain-containing protein [Chloroflexota bacterium]
MSTSPPRFIGLIPARAGSKRVPNKNIRPLARHPLIAYTITAALESHVFDAVVVSTDSPRIAKIAQYYGADVPFMRPEALAGDRSPDIEWVEFTLQTLANQGKSYDGFSILRPTSPFRKAATIIRAHSEFMAQVGVDSLRAVEKCKQHPAKMWVVRGQRMTPLLPLGPIEQPWHSSQYHSLPEVYVQNASLEIAWMHVVTDGRTIAGNVLMPFLTTGDEGYDVNDVADWLYAEHLLTTGEATLPPISRAPIDLPTSE